MGLLRFNYTKTTASGKKAQIIACLHLDRQRKDQPRCLTHREKVDVYLELIYSNEEVYLKNRK